MNRAWLLGLVMVAGCAGQVASTGGVTALPLIDVHAVDAGAPAAPVVASEAAPPPTRLRPGVYGAGLMIAIDTREATINGKYESATGWDESTDSPRFTCSVDFSGALTDGPSINVTGGVLEILSPTSFRLRLDEEPGGCWNVDQDFASGIVDPGTVFTLGEPSM